MLDCALWAFFNLAVVISGLAATTVAAGGEIESIDPVLPPRAFPTPAREWRNAEPG